MTVKAYVLIEMKTEDIAETVAELRRKKGIKNASSVSGPYDIVAVIETDKYDDIPHIVAKEIRGLPGVDKTITLLAFD